MPKGIYIDWSKYDAKIRKMAGKLNMVEIAEKIGIDHGTVKAYMRRKGIKASKAVILEAGDKALIGGLAIEHGMKAKDIAPKFGIGVSYCHQIIKEQKLLSKGN